MISAHKRTLGQPLPRRDFHRRRRALGWTLAETGRRATPPVEDRGFVSRVVRKVVKAPGVYRRLVEAIERGEREQGA